MHQILWAEQMIKNKATERIKADHYLHIHVILNNNNLDLLQKSYKFSNQNMEGHGVVCLTSNQSIS